jgi:hypothetical protein
MHQETDAELLERFRRLHPKYTAKTLQGLFDVKRAQAFGILQGKKLNRTQRKLLMIYNRYPDICHFLLKTED